MSHKIRTLQRQNSNVLKYECMSGPVDAVTADAMYYLCLDSSPHLKEKESIESKQWSWNPNKSWGEKIPSYRRICVTSLKMINPTFKAEGEINSNEGRLASWADEVYYYPTASAAAADDCDDTDEDRSNIQIFKSLSRHTWGPLVRAR